MKKRFRFLAALLFLGGLALLPAAAESDATNNPALAAPVTDPALVAAQYRQVLARPEYQEAAEPDVNDALRSWLSRLLARFGQKFEQFQYAQEMPRFASMLMAVFIVAAMAGLLYVSVRVLRRRMDPKFLERPDAPAEKMLTPAPSMTRSELQTRTSRKPCNWHAARGSRAWLQFLARLENRRTWSSRRPQPHQPRISCRSLRAQPGHEPALPLVLGVVDAYDRFIYGRRPIAEPEWRSFQGQLDEAGGGGGGLLLHLTDRPTPSPT